MAKKKSGIDWKKSSCCGADRVRVAGIDRCEKCQREIVRYAHDDERGVDPNVYYGDEG